MKKAQNLRESRQEMTILLLSLTCWIAIIAATILGTNNNGTQNPTEIVCIDGIEYYLIMNDKYQNVFIEVSSDTESQPFCD